MAKQHKIELTVTVACEHVHLCRCPADARRKYSYPRVDWPLEWSLTLLLERMTVIERK